MLHTAFYKTPHLGWLAMKLDEQATIVTAAFADHQPRACSAAPTHISEALDAYFKNAAVLPTSLYRFPTADTVFRQAVWHSIANIPLGQTITYAALAAHVGNPNAARAVGSACGKNPLALFIPCHRVVSAHSRHTHYRWDSERKRTLLQHEGVAWPLADTSDD